LNNNELHSYLKDAMDSMAKEYIRIYKRVKEDPGTAGDQGEENWASLLRNWLPPSYQVVTKGRILNADGNASPQIDILILSPKYPKHLLDKKLYLAGGVVAAFECKITLRPEHIKRAIQNTIKVKQLIPSRAGSRYKELNSPIIFGLLAHSHSWKNSKSNPIELIHRNILKYDELYVNHPRQMIDLICISDLATWIASKGCPIHPYKANRRLRENELPEKMIEELKKHYTTTSYVCFSKNNQGVIGAFNPVGSMICNLFNIIAWKYQGIRNLAQYFIMAKLMGFGSGYQRKWDSSIYTYATREKVISGEYESREKWNDWSIHFY